MHTLFLIFHFAGSWVEGGLLAAGVRAWRSARTRRVWDEAGRAHADSDLEAAHDLTTHLAVS